MAIGVLLRVWQTPVISTVVVAVPDRIIVIWHCTIDRILCGYYRKHFLSGQYVPVHPTIIKHQSDSHHDHLHPLYSSTTLKIRTSTRYQVPPGKKYVFSFYISRRCLRWRHQTFLLNVQRPQHIYVSLLLALAMPSSNCDRTIFLPPTEQLGEFYPARPTMPIHLHHVRIYQQ